LSSRLTLSPITVGRPGLDREADVPHSARSSRAGRDRAASSAGKRPARWLRREDYLDAFLTAGLYLAKLADIPAMASVREPKTILLDGARFPRFMLLAFTKP